MDGRVPLPLVLAVASAMLCVGAVSFWGAWHVQESSPRLKPTSTRKTVVDPSTPERAAESFLDAWRRRDHAAARRLAVGPARAAVEHRQTRDESVSAGERVWSERIWDKIADERLTLRIHQSERVSERRMALRGTAEGRFLESPYAREVDFVLIRNGEAWRVERFEFGAISNQEPEETEPR